ncbi:ABC transporter permease [Natrarchaeobaculum aegyptiacum]|uniref:ABC transporter permease n=1 Tax=Natrarchaeobaculum aegyptiacum TaxID=745377 RepID=A0A2Z2I1B7_9EURY|nr:ABC transporter permease [Natrarchaeobaculum aegyptiacum]ARS91554.1 ABC transporter permease [Natrarchaeobaculum aegyptiacum]
MSPRSTVRWRAAVGIALASLRRSPARTTLAVLAVALAVLSVTVLASLGVGVVAMGEDGLENADRDVWVSSDPVDPATSGAENPIVGSHELSVELAERDDVRAAAPIAMHDVYVGTDPDDLERESAVGVQATHDGFDFEEGGGFDTFDDVYENGRSNEPTTEEIVLDPAVADELGVEVGDTIYVGTSRETAPDHEFTVVGTSDYYSQFLGSETVTVPLGDLQALAGTTGTDRATFVTAALEDDADADADEVAAELDEEYPEYDVRSSDDQMGAFLEERPLVLASGVTLVGLAVVGGLVLTTNLFALVTAQQREELAALRAVGLSKGLLAGTVGTQGVVVGLLGGLVGLAATPIAVGGLNRFSRSVIGFEDVLSTPLEVYVIGLGLALFVGTVVAVVTGFRAGRFARVEHLEE